MDSQDEPEIARGLREGRTTAWEALYDAFARSVWQFVARRMGSHAGEVADVVQETFLAAARSARHYDPARGSLGTWLNGIARRQVGLYYRSRERHERHAARPPALAAQGPSLLQQVPDRQPEPGQAAFQRELAGLVHETLTALPLDYETLLTARYMEGIPVDDLAVQESCSTTALRSRLARARTAFRDAFLRRTTS